MQKLHMNAVASCNVGATFFTTHWNSTLIITRHYVHNIALGTAGCDEVPTDFGNMTHDWSDWWRSNYGYYVGATIM